MRLSWLAAAFLVALGTHSASAADPDATTAVRQVRIGLGNAYRLGSWLPVSLVFDENHATATGDSQSVLQRRYVAQALDGESVPARFLGPEKLAHSGQPYQIYIRIGRPHSTIQIFEHGSNEREVSDTTADASTGQSNSTATTVVHTIRESDMPRPIPDTHEWFLEIGGRLDVLDLLRRIDPNEPDRMTVVSLSPKDAAEQLPDRWYGYEGVDTVAIVGAEALTELAGREEAIEALWQWCNSGGTLLIVCGEHADRLIGPGAPLARFVPGEFSRMRDVRQFVAIENYATADQRLDFNEVNLTLRVPELRNVTGKIELAETHAGSIPLIVRGSVGFGKVIFVGLDLHKPPFSTWNDRAKFLDKLLERRIVRQTESVAAEGVASRTKRLGYSDLSGQMRGALDHFQGIEPTPFWFVAGLAFIYIAALLPLNYFLCNRWLQRPRLAWVILPCLAVGFGWLAYELTFRTKGNQFLVNQIDLVDVSTAGKIIRGATWLSLYSPENSTFDLAAETQTEESTQGGRNPDVPLAWFGLPGSGFGGMSSQAMTTPLFNQEYSIDPAAGRIWGIPISIWSSRSFVARWLNAEASPAIGTIRADVSRTFDRLLEGSISSELPWSLNGAVILYDRSVYPLGTLESKQSVRLARNQFQPIDTFLTKRDVNATRDVVPPYDRAGSDIMRILEVMGFHRAAGGSDYSGLVHRHLSWMDLSHELDRGNAVVMGYGPPGATIAISGIDETPEIDRHMSIYRFVIPVR